ncbi:ead/Ea22-like family protein [Salmonella enterica subsp. enterica serovar Agbeni]|nr:ead/Ea22-like family protein [Salmonella enterica subsp. enterica serovar Agbeni]
MSNIDKQALLKIAGIVDREEWDVLDNGDDEYQVIVSGSLERGATYRSYRPVANEIPEQEIAAFIAAANPATVLALLDENIQLQRGKDAMEAVALALRDDMRDAREKLEAAERRIAELDKRLIEYAGIATREARRVAELGSFHTAYLEWSDKTEWVQNDKRFDVVRPLGKHRADVLRKYIEHLEARQIALPQRLSPEGYHIDEAYMVDDAEGEYLDRDAVIEAISAAGIKVIEGEEQ